MLEIPPCRSKKLAEMINNYSDYFHRYRLSFPYTETRYQYSVDDHQKMLEALKKKNPRRVERLVRNRLGKTKEMVTKAIDEGKMEPRCFFPLLAEKSGKEGP